jgi:hypothetical protein
MTEQGEQPEAVFEIFWYQHNPDDWTAEVLDQRTGERRRVYSLEELMALIQPPPRRNLTESIDPGPGR